MSTKTIRQPQNWFYPDYISLFSAGNRFIVSPAQAALIPDNLCSKHFLKVFVVDSPKYKDVQFDAYRIDLHGAEDGPIWSHRVGKVFNKHKDITLVISNGLETTPILPKGSRNYITEFGTPEQTSVLIWDGDLVPDGCMYYGYQLALVDAGPRMVRELKHER